MTDILQIAKDQLDKELDEWETSAMSQWEKLAPKTDEEQFQGNSIEQNKELEVDLVAVNISSPIKRKLTVKIASGEVLKGGKGSGNFGHSGRPGEVGGSGNSKSGIVWNPNGRSIVMRGGNIPKNGPIFLSADSNVANSYDDNRGVGLYQIDMKKNVLVSGSREWDDVLGDKAEEYAELGPELFSDPPNDFILKLDAAGYVGYSSNSGNYIRVEEWGKHIIEQISKFKQLQIKLKEIEK